jgi:DNA-binding response OmpR family regulator
MLNGVSKRSQHILIIDDDNTLLRIMAKIFQKQGYIVNTAQNGLEALSKLEGKSYAAALIDVKLPDMNGLDLLNRLRTIAPGMTKIILTGYPSDEDRVRALDQGADYYLAKPIKPEILVEIIRTKLKTSTWTQRDFCR